MKFPDKGTQAVFHHPPHAIPSFAAPGDAARKGEAEHHYREALVFGSLGIICFSLTLPATRIADPAFGGIVIGLGRALVAAVLAGGVLLLRRERVLAWRYWRSLAIVALGVVVGFPVCSALALQSLPAAHGAVVAGLLPAVTAVFAVLRAGERPGPAFWASCGLGVLAVLLFAVIQGAGRPQPADALLVAAVVLGGLGYAEGGRLARELGGWRVICWALLLAAPFLLGPVALAIAQRGIEHILHAPPQAWLGLAYVSCFSMLLGFFAWYHGLARGGVARISQLQLAQPLLTLGWSALLLHEAISGPMVVAALLIIASVAASQRARAAGQGKSGKTRQTGRD